MPPSSPCLPPLPLLLPTHLATVGINSTSGSIVDLSFAWGEVVIDEAKQRLVYGPGGGRQRGA